MSELAQQRIEENIAMHELGVDASFLDLSTFKLTKLEHQVPELSGMWWVQHINLSSNQFSDGSFLENLPGLTSLDLRSNHISDIRFLENLTSLTSLNLGNNQISDIRSLKNLKRITSLDLRSNHISDGHFLKNLARLASLNLGWNRISDISFLENLTGLTSLNLSYNQISDISVLENLPGLISLYLDSNQISDIHFGENLPGLTLLSLRRNQISDIRFLENLTSLTSLNLENNQISDIGALENLTGLTLLQLDDNQISDLTPLLPLIEKGVPLTMDAHDGGGINLHNNPLTNPPPEIAQQGNAAILQYFEERKKKKQFKNTEIKLILIGNSTAGKTSLSRYLRERVYAHGQPTTHGIQNHRWVPEGRELQVNCWDFGGQEYYHATHRLFLSHNSVYTLVWDAQTDAGGYCDTDIHYEYDPAPHRVRLEHFSHRWWLQNIRHYTQGSNPPVPVLLVQNKCVRDGVRRVSSDLEQPPYVLLPEWLDNAIDLAAFAEDAPEAGRRTWTRRFEEFEERLLDKLETQLTHYEFADYHRDIRDEVRRLAAAGVNDMPFADFEAMCRGFDEDAKMDLVRIYLHDITGDILYYPEHPRLRERVFLRPDWVCNRIYAILSRKVLKDDGLFDMDWVQQALQCDVEEASDFVELMREFELIFDDSDEQGLPTGQYVAPQYLPDTCPIPDRLEAAKDFAKPTHAFTLWFSDFLPKSHIARFVAHWGSQAQHRLFWKNGLLFRTADCTTLVERVEGNRIRVEIQTGQPTREEAMRQVFQSFLKLEEGEAGFAVSMNEEDFVNWPAVREAVRTGARVVPSHSTAQGFKKYVALSAFQILLQPAKMTAKKIFISYAHADEAAMQELDKFLGPLERKGEIAIWTDRKILPGQRWKEEILHNLETADITLLLVSANFLDSDFIHEEEIPRALRRMEEHGKVVIPIILNHCFWDISPLASIQALPKDAQPIAGFPNPAQAWNEVARGVMARLRGLEPTAPAADTVRLTTDTSITNSKNVVSGSTITAERVHIGDVIQYGDQPKPSANDKAGQTPLPILMLTANPAGTTKINLDKEHARIAEKLQGQHQRFALQVRRAVDAVGFKEFTEQTKPFILHFSGHGHGGEYGGIVVQNDDHSGTQLLAPAALGGLFAYFQEEQIGIQLVILNACYSEAQAEAIANHVPYVVGTTVEIADDAAIAFSIGFYFKLAESGMDFEKAYKSGCAQAALSGGDKSDFVLFKEGVKEAGTPHPSKPREAATRAHTPTDILQWPTEGCLRPTCTRTVLNELLVRRQSVNLTGGHGQGKSRLLRDLKDMAAAQGLRVALLSLKEHRLQYANFLRAAAMQLGLPRTDYADFADLVSDLSLLRDTPYLLLLDEIEVLNEYRSNDPRYNAHFVASLNLLKNLDHLHLLCASREWLKAVVFDGETSLLTLHPIALPTLSQQEIQAELYSRLHGHELLQNAAHLAQAREAVQAAAQPYVLLERLISQVQMGYVAGRFDHFLKELRDGR